MSLAAIVKDIEATWPQAKGFAAQQMVADLWSRQARWFRREKLALPVVKGLAAAAVAIPLVAAGWPTAASLTFLGGLNYARHEMQKAKAEANTEIVDDMSMQFRVAMDSRGFELLPEEGHRISVVREDQTRPSRFEQSIRAGVKARLAAMGLA